jgi:hypothetical protein
MNRKALLLLFVVLTLAVSSVFATESRMAALGNPFGFIRDNTDIHAYPGVIHQYENNVRAELPSSSVSSWKLGANLPFLSNKLGVYLNTDTRINVANHLPTANNFVPGDLDISKKIQFYYGFMDKFGVGFGMAIDSKKKDIADNPDKFAELNASYFELSGGMSDEKMDIGVALAFWGAGTKNDIDQNETSMGGFGFSAQGRYFLMETDEFGLVAAANLGLMSGSDEEKLATTETKDYSTMNFDLGVGLNYQFAEMHKLVLGFKPLSIISEGWEETDPSGKDKGGESWLFLPTYTIGLESQIAPWLVGRVGATQNYAFYGYNYDPDGNANTETAEYQSSFNMDMGLGFKFGKFCIDTVLSQSLLHDGPNFIGGRSNGLAGKVSVNFNY